MASSWSQAEQSRKIDESLERMREKRREEEEQAKAMERSAKFNLAAKIAGDASSIVAEIIKLEDSISDRETGQPDPTWKVSLKEQEMIEDIEKLEEYYSSQRIMMRETCEKRCADLRANLEVALQNRLIEERSVIEKRRAKLSALDTRKEMMISNQKIPVSLKKMKRELSNLIEKYPRVSSEWVFQGYKQAELNSMFDIPTDYKKHLQYINNQKRKSEATPVENLKNESQGGKGERGTENEISGGGIYPPPPRKMKSVSGQPIPLEIPKNTFTEIIPGKKFLEYSQKEKENMDHGSYYELWNVFQEEQQAERENKERLMKAKLSKEDDEAEADQIRDERAQQLRDEKIEQDWKEIIESNDMEDQE